MKKIYIYSFFLLTLFILLSPSVSFAGPEFTLIYVVQSGDTLSEIAEDYGVTVQEIKNLNNIGKEHWIKVGDELVIPKRNNDDSNNPNWGLQLYRDTEEIMNNFQLDIGNNYSVQINPGMKIPKVNIPKSKMIQYHVGQGDTLFDLARAFNTSIGVLMAVNEMQDSIIRTGDQIWLPVNNLSKRQVLQRTVNQSQLNVLARAIHGEARGEPYVGQVAVGAVIINRVLSDYFPDTITEVVYQNRQFSAVGDGQINLRPNSTSYKAARAALNGQDPTMGSLYFYNPETATNTGWFDGRKLVVTIGDHVFTK